MNVRNCKTCGKMFNYVAGPNICTACREEVEAKFHQVKDYIRDNHGCGVQEVAEVCEVTIQQIHHWLKDERLELSEGASGIELQCEKCGKAIFTGKFCEKCKQSMSDNLTGLYKTEKKTVEKKKDPKAAAKMRFLE